MSPLSLDSCPDLNPNPIVVLDRAGNVLYANQPAQAIEGLDEFFAHSGFASQPGPTLEVVTRHCGREFVLNAVLKSDQWFCYCTEITELRDAERKASYLASFPQSNPLPVVEFDRHGAVRYANPSATELITEIVQKGLRDKRVAWVKTESTRCTQTPVNRTIDINKRAYLVTATYNASTQTYRCYFVDITERRLAELRLSQSRIELIQRLTRAAEWRDNETGIHIKRMSAYCRVVAKKLNLAREITDIIELAATMHDIGKIGIPDAILHKPGKLTDAEFEIMKTHTTIGANLLMGSEDPMLDLAREIALGHHEKWDGSGYPNGLAGDHIPLCARIASVCDVFDALTSERPYKAAWPTEAALFELQRGVGTAFDPMVVDAFLAGLDEILDIQHKWRLVEALSAAQAA